MFYAVRHQTRFRYTHPIQENLMEVRMQPRTDGSQHCLNFQLHLRPHARVAHYQDHLGNVIHQFDVPGLHNELLIRAEALVKVAPTPELPAALSEEDWQRIDDYPMSQELWEMRTPSRFTSATPALDELAAELEVGRTADPLTTLRRLNRLLNQTFAYTTQVTHVDSPIDDAIQQRRGVCQDYAHIMLALLRNHLRLPCRYVSGYLFHRQNDRSAVDASHAWVEVLLPSLGWLGFDPTNDLVAGERHIRVAIGRDYGDVPPTRGVFKGEAASELSVSVHVRKADDPTSHPIGDFADQQPGMGMLSTAPIRDLAEQQQQQQQQQ
ncbi:MAG TPA: transglutaminase family protein [Caldilineaceae bacterium]|nr:transglutaminase family protein [Caldilineaceae bacterium]